MGKEVFESRGLQGREDLVEQIKTKAGELDDLLIQISADKKEGENRIRPQQCQRLTATARTNLELAVMLAVKAVSRS